MQVERRAPQHHEGLPDVGFTEVVAADAARRTRVDVAELAAGAILPRHPAGPAQTFYVVAGRGRVAGADDVEVPVGPGDAVTWEPGEEHTSWADTAMTVVVVQARPGD